MPHFWCGVMKLSRISLLPLRLDVVDAGGGLQVHRRAVAAEALAEGDHPRVVQVELLAAGERAPGDQLVHVGVAGVVADGLALDAAPGGRADDLARLRLDVAEADLLVLAVQRQVGVVAARSACPAPARPSPRRGRWSRAPAAGSPRRRRCRSRSSACPGSRLRPATMPLSWPSCSTSVCVFQPMPLPPLPSLSISGPSAVKRLKTFG